MSEQGEHVSLAYVYMLSRKLERSDFEVYFYSASAFIYERYHEFLSEIKESRVKKGMGIEEKILKIYDPNQHNNFINSIILRLEVEDFLVYLKDLLSVIFRAEPRAMASSDTVSIQEVVKSDSIDELKEYCISQIMTRVAFFGFKEIRRELSNRGVDVGLSAEDEQQITKAINLRNNMVHDYGIHSYLINKENNDEEKLQINVEQLRNYKSVLLQCVEKYDSSACQKFSLREKKLAVPKPPEPDTTPCSPPS